MLILLKIQKQTFRKTGHQRPAKSKIFNPNPSRKKILIPETRPEPEKKFFSTGNSLYNFSA